MIPACEAHPHPSPCPLTAVIQFLSLGWKQSFTRTAVENRTCFSFTFQLKETEIGDDSVSHWLKKAFLFIGVQLSSNFCKVRETKQNPTQFPHTSTDTHTHIHTHSSFPSKQKSILMNQIMQTLFKCLNRMRIGLNASQFSFLITMKSQVSKVLGHKEVSLDLQDILTHAEVLCWL